MENINDFDSVRNEQKAIQNSTPSEGTHTHTQDFSHLSQANNPYAGEYATEEETAKNRGINSASEGVEISPLLPPTDLNNPVQFAPRTNLAAGNNDQNLAGQLPPTTEKAIDNAFSGNIGLQANEETPPALAPLFKVADVLEQELPKQDQLTPQTKQAAAENILANANDAKLNKYAQYLGRGGKIYVHVLYYKAPVKFNEGKTDIEYTKKHYEDAAIISNERFKKLDVNLSVVIVWDENANPLTREEFQTRKADKTKRKAMPNGFDEAYNPMDTYMAVDANDREYIEKAKRKDASPATIGSDVWIPKLYEEPSKKDWTGFIDKDTEVLGKSSASQFVGFLNSNEIRRACRLFGYSDKEFSNFQNIEDINNQISKTIALAIEHEVGHSKFILHSSNHTTGTDIPSTSDNYHENYSGLKQVAHTRKALNGIPEKDAKNTTLGLKKYLNDTSKKPFVSREDFFPDSATNGHILETIMDERVKSYYIENMEHQVASNLQEGYDTYMITMLQLLHGTQKGGVFSIDEYNSTLEKLRKERDMLLTLLLSTNMKESDAIILYFDSLERKIEAYVDVLRLLDMRTDFQDFLIDKNLKTQQKIHPIHGQNTFETIPQD